MLLRGSWEQLEGQAPECRWCLLPETGMLPLRVFIASVTPELPTRALEGDYPSTCYCTRTKSRWRRHRQQAGHLLTRGAHTHLLRWNRRLIAHRVHGQRNHNEVEEGTVRESTNKLRISSVKAVRILILVRVRVLVRSDGNSYRTASGRYARTTRTRTRTFIVTLGKSETYKETIKEKSTILPDITVQYP